MKILFLLLCFLSANTYADPMELFWEDMIPKNYTVPEANVNHDGSMIQQSLEAPIVPELNGKLVKIPGFVVPLEGDNDTTTEFLLVPYFGACIHVPPPPPNQIVYVKFSTGVPIENLYDAVWVTGTLETQSWEGDIATVGYRLSGIKVVPYDG